MKKNLMIAATATMVLALSGCKQKEVKTVKVGLLHSLTGTMAMSETPVT